VSNVTQYGVGWDGAALRCWRERRGWTVQRLAVRIAVSPKTVYAYERGRVPPLCVAHRIVRETRGGIRYRDIYPEFMPEFA
jgi:DNA-binding XRE family transcriptional regulator